jgi:hypothetical protein
MARPDVRGTARQQSIGVLEIFGVDMPHRHEGVDVAGVVRVELLGDDGFGI